MRLSLLILTIAIVFSMKPASAGFEWLPPTQVAAAPTRLPAVISTPPSSTSFEELYSQETTSINSPQVSSQHNISPKKQGLVIDPYPLRVGGTKVAVDSLQVEQAMIEEGRILNPVPLGMSAKTSTQSRVMLSTNPVPFLVPEKPARMSAAITPMTDEFSPVNDTNMTYDKAVGFARAVPLSLALSQVVPAEFSYSYDKNVDKEQVVSWEGGAPWNQVLNNMLQTRGLKAAIQGNDVIIQTL